MHVVSFFREYFCGRQFGRSCANGCSSGYNRWQHCSHAEYGSQGKRGTKWDTGGGSSSVSTSDAEVEAVGDSLNYMYLFKSSSASASDAGPYSFLTVSSTQAVASTGTVALESKHASGEGDRWVNNTKQY